MFQADIPPDVDKLYFFQLFVTNEVMIETNLYAHEYLDVNNARLSETSRMKRWVDMDLAKMKKIVAMYKSCVINLLCQKCVDQT